MKKSCQAKSEKICECDRPGLCLDIYYVDDVCVQCGGKIKKGAQGDWWKK